MKKRLSSSLSAGIAINIIAIALVKSINIIAAPVMTGILTTVDYGIYSIYFSWSQIIGIVAGLGVIGSLTNFRVKFEPKDYHRYCWHILCIGIIGHLFLLTVSCFLKETISIILKLPEMLIPLMVISAMSSYCVSFLSTYYLIDNMALHNAGIGLLTVAGSFSLSLAFIYFQNLTTNLYFPFIEGNLAINLIISLGCVVFFALRGKGGIRVDYVKYSLSIGIPLIFHSLAGFVLGSSDRIMIQQMVDLSTAGVYSFTYGFAAVLSSIWSAINSIWAPFFFRYLKEDDTISMLEKKRNFDFLFLMLIMSFMLVYPEVFKLLANERYWGQIKIVPIIVIAFFANHLYSFPTNYETYKEKTKYVAIGSIGAALVNIILNFLLIPLWHEFGAAIATALSYIALYMFHLYIAKRVIGNYPFEKSISPEYVILLTLTVAAAYLLFDYWWVRWLIGFGVGFVLLRDLIKRRNIL